MEVPKGSISAGLRVESFKEEGKVICTLRCCWWCHVWRSHALPLAILVTVFFEVFMGLAVRGPKPVEREVTEPVHLGLLHSVVW